jgi:MYXO-CTERM domain-containing protein
MPVDAAAPHDAGKKPDAAAANDAATGDGGDGGGSSGENGGCGCRVVEPRNDGGSLLAFAFGALGLVAGVRRRRRARR